MFRLQEKSKNYAKFNDENELILSNILDDVDSLPHRQKYRTIHQLNIFVVLRISKDKEQRKSAIEFVSKTKSLGEIKEIPQGQIDAENFLTIELFEGAKRVKTIFMPHPLYKRIEYFDGNKLATKYVELEKEEFFIRFQMSVGSSNKVRISETLNGLKSTKLTVIKL
ncbi:MAG: hypothetical protein IPN76_07350 [Saprospiraceae bacterium]|nr:hypothetical protein [Saprospiraceae bacterium]